MEKFIDRKNELDFLNREYQKKESSLIILYGRRRIGKTSLIKEFGKDKDMIYLLATEESELQNMVTFKKTATGPLINEKGEQAHWNIYIKKYLGDAMGAPSTLISKKFITRKYKNR